MADEFEPEFDSLREDVRTEILALSLVLEKFGPQLGRPRVDTLKGSRHANMKELRFSVADGEWRVAFAFDPNAGRFCSLRETNLVGAKSGFIANLYGKPINVSTPTLPG